MFLTGHAFYSNTYMKKQDPHTVLKKKIFQKIFQSLWAKLWSQINRYKCSCIVTKVIILPHYSYHPLKQSAKNTFEEV